ncbi:MAG TPA: hypothetical protein VEC37_15290 [Bacillota bacterium]|nr:hypothetical protein [Bacillota bacterium]
MNTNERGSILMFVTWVLSLLGIIATFLIYRSEAEWAVVSSHERNRLVREMAEQILAEQLTLLLEDETEKDTPEEQWFGKTGRFVTERNGCQITVLVEDEGSKPNINLMNKSALCQFVPQDLSVAPVLDWCDPDQNELENGAETPYYKSLKPAYQPRDGFFSSLQEVLAVKGGRELYPYLAPELTVYGKININVLTPDQFGFILKAAGFDKFSADIVVAEFRKKMIDLKGTKDFAPVTSMEVLGKWHSLNAIQCEKLKPVLKFSGSSNVNFMSLKGLAALLLVASHGRIPAEKSETLAQKIVKFCHQSNPIDSLEELKNLLGEECTSHFKVEDYFTLASSILRYRIWVSKGNHKYFLNTVQERVAGDLFTKWRVRTLSWQGLLNSNTPEIPAMTSFEAARLLETKATN